MLLLKQHLQIEKIQRRIGFPEGIKINLLAITDDCCKNMMIKLAN